MLSLSVSPDATLISIPQDYPTVLEQALWYFVGNASKIHVAAVEALSIRSIDFCQDAARALIFLLHNNWIKHALTHLLDAFLVAYATCCNATTLRTTLDVR